MDGVKRSKLEAGYSYGCIDKCEEPPTEIEGKDPVGGADEDVLGSEDCESETDSSCVDSDMVWSRNVTREGFACVVTYDEQFERIHCSCGKV